MYDCIVVPTDGSDEASRAAEEAYRIAEGTGATVHLLSVVDESVSTLLLSDESLGPLVERLTDDAETAVGSLAGRAPEGVPVETEVVRGTQIYRAIVNYADRVGADLIVMGSRGSGGVTNLLGSTSERVAAHTDLPVLLLSPNEDEE